MNMRSGSFKDQTFTGAEAKDVRDTAMLNTQAKEAPEHISATNEQKEYMSENTSAGKLGARGHAGGN